MKLRTSVLLGLLASGVALTLLDHANNPHSGQRSEAPPTLQAANELEQQVCQENAYRGDAPAYTDCSHLPDGPIYEDDPWGRWDCRTMGNLTCGPMLDLDQLDRPGCFIEPASTPNGWDIVRYTDIRQHTDEFGFEIPCPTR